MESGTRGTRDLGSSLNASPDEAAVTTSDVLRVRQREEVYREILLRFFLLMKTAQMTDTVHADFEEALERFMQPLGTCLAAEGSFVVCERDGYLFLNATRARVDAQGFPAHKYLVQTLVDSEFTGILFERGVLREEVVTFLDVFFRPGKPTSAQTFAGLVEERSIRHIHPILRNELAVVVADEPASAPGRNGPFFSRRTYFKTIFVLRHLLEGIGPTCCLDLREAKQIAQSIVEHVLEDEDAALALDLIREWDRGLFEHSVNVAILSVALGRRMGLGRTLQGDIGVAALFHDIGDLGRATAAAAKGGSPASFRRLVMKGGSSRMMLRSALVAWEHHGGGEDRGGESLPARIVGVADRFERSVRGADGRARSPQAALACLPRGPDAEILTVLEAIVEETRAIH